MIVPPASGIGAPASVFCMIGPPASRIVQDLGLERFYSISGVSFLSDTRLQLVIMILPPASGII